MINTPDTTHSGVGPTRQPLRLYASTPGSLWDCSCYQETMEGLHKKIV
ncbi:hypothetical protein [uncultured Nitrospira sp.]